MKYSDRFIVFLDLLGFRNIIERTVSDDQLRTGIYEILNSFRKENISAETYTQINKVLIDPKELSEVEKTMKLLGEAMGKAYDITYTHFSDSLVISCPVEQEDSCFIVFELLARLNFRLWDEYGIVIRGGVTIGSLIHEESGPLFGPGMVRAYDLESKLASNPRILIDSNIVVQMKKSEHFARTIHLFDEAGDGMFEITLASSISFLIQSIYSLHKEVRAKYLRAMKNAIPSLEEIVKKESDEKVKAKYAWLHQKVTDHYGKLPSGLVGR